ncbi:hypothetical protein EIP91_005236 [Steccherinum ochraceum]|uniref:Uncharacterized protein n=1 Tax=Steccherinum ochraceum TaxID=92696 RepID=A0A4R0RDI1_9APHY|nr:hypothetical protein EIP91_005236 [Steccherinum ochraceum]
MSGSQASSGRGSQSPPPEDQLQLSQAHKRLCLAITNNLLACVSKRKRGRAKGRQRRKKVGDDEDSGYDKDEDVVAAYRSLACWVPRAYDLFADMDQVFDLGIRADAASDIAEFERDLTPVERRHLTTYRKIIVTKPSLSRLLSSPALLEDEDGSGYEALVSLFTVGFNQGRCDDTKKLKKVGMEYAIPPGWPQCDTPDWGTGTKKSGRGFFNKMTARLLCPHEIVSDFDSDPNETMAALQDGRIPVTSVSFPTFLYPFHHEYNQFNLREGLCRSEIIVKVYRHLFTGPASALEAGKRTTGPPPLAISHRLKHVTPRTLCYVICQIRVMLCSREAWNIQDGLFNLREFYDHLVALFEEKPGPNSSWTKTTLAWLDARVFQNIPEVAPLRTFTSDFDRLASEADD